MARFGVRFSPEKPRDDRGAYFVETGVLVTLAAGIIISVAQSPIGDQFHDSVREMVCLVEGPECGGETWTEHDRPEEPDIYQYSPATVWNGEIKGEGDARVAIQFALSQQGDPYVWGGTGPDGWDCSGLLQAAWRAAGVEIPRTTWPQHAALPPVSMADLQPGDLIFFQTIPGPPPTHVGMYIGDGMMVHAGNPVQVVPFNDYWKSRWVGAGRVPQK
ncbi:C40 family peptidase [Marinactinospora thermotolerans]|uniref:Cell wall-associated hydrolases (Invasion-associated proteins) n=1 Tax=Marinactinospora thermotolerans DSM 45154 TaxID=1122192 RepID=A0A1T4RPD7_9ACTN|nr:NlpC/P60 family protein [Marinactinospora thermotolerans]SKA17824.1 Cell wall-associated hydrolases (invasion-associated proteins) [Marinactinospora thermotolerans DSM 45154]